MQTFTELETQAAKMMAKVADRRKEGREGLLENIRVNPEEFDFLEADNSRYRAFFDCEVCNASTIRCAHNPLINGTIRRTYSAPIQPEQVEGVEHVGNFEKPTGLTGRKNRVKRTYSEEELKQFVKAYADGGSIKDVSEQFNVAANIVYDTVKAEGIMRPKGYRHPDKPQVRRGRVAQVFTQEQKDEWVKIYSTGKSVKETADQAGVGVNYVYLAVKESGKMRPKGSGLKPRVATKPKVVKDPNAPKKPRGKQRTTLLLTPELLAKALKAYKTGPNAGKMVAVALAMNLAPHELSQAMKDAGIAITKGKKKVV